MMENIELGAHERKNNTLTSLSSKTVGTCVFTLIATKASISRGACSAMQGPKEEAEVDKLVSEVMVGRSNWTHDGESSSEGQHMAGSMRRVSGEGVALVTR
jgi:hypothetical protein